MLIMVGFILPRKLERCGWLEDMQIPSCYMEYASVVNEVSQLDY